MGKTRQEDGNMKTNRFFLVTSGVFIILAVFISEIVYTTNLNTTLSLGR